MSRLPFIAAALLGSCSVPTEEEKAVLACETWVKDRLAAPSTYRRINGSSAAAGTHMLVSLSYEASNQFGVPLRESTACAFKIVAGKADFSGHYDDGKGSEDSRQAWEEARRARARADDLIEKLNGTPPPMCCDAEYWDKMGQVNSTKAR
jgi:hypothetical protein